GASWGSAAAIALLAATGTAMADDTVQFGASDAKSVFYIAKNQNKNQVHFGVRLDAGCHPVGRHPVYGYWRMFENGGTIEPVLAREGPAYGLQDVQQISTTPAGAQIVVRMRAFPERPLTISVRRGEGQCEAHATTAVNGADAQLNWIYVRFKWPFGVDY